MEVKTKSRTQTKRECHSLRNPTVDRTQLIETTLDRIMKEKIHHQTLKSHLDFLDKKES